MRPWSQDSGGPGGLRGPAYRRANVAAEPGSRRAPRRAARARRASRRRSATTVGAPNGTPDCTMTPARSSAAATASASAPTSTRTKFVALPGSGSSPRARSSAVRASIASRFARAPPLDLVASSEARERGHLGERADVVAALHLPHRRDDRGRPDAVADPQPGQAVELRERPQREHVVPGADELGDRVEPVGGIEVVEVGLVDHRAARARAGRATNAISSSRGTTRPSGCSASR